MQPNPFHLSVKTIGGSQLWTDHRWRNGWRLQQHAWTGHWRLLDENDVRRASGSREACLEVLQQAQPDHAQAKGEVIDTDPAGKASVSKNSGEHAVEAPRHAVILLHGLLRTHRSMRPMEDALRQQDPWGGKPIDVVRFSYASSRRPVSDHAAALGEVIDGLPPTTELSFIAHSMGNIVVRYWIGDLQRHGDPHDHLRRCRSMVMIGPPNQGAAIARRLSRVGLFQLVTGPGGMELGPEWTTFVEKLAVPPFPFAIIAGRRPENAIQNPLVDGEGDFIVSVEEAKLEGAEKFLTVDGLHTFLMRDPKVIDFAVDFLAIHAEKAQD